MVAQQRKEFEAALTDLKGQIQKVSAQLEAEQTCAANGQQSLKPPSRFVLKLKLALQNYRSTPAQHCAIAVQMPGKPSVQT
jgi:hypothetical protein